MTPPFSEVDNIYSGCALLNAINTIVAKYNLIKIDYDFLPTQEPSPFIRQVEILRSCRTLGMIKSKNYKNVIDAIGGRQSKSKPCHITVIR